MTFHPVHGGNIVLGDEFTRADRTHSFFDGVVFSCQPLVPEKFYTLMLGYSDDVWEDGLRIGVTTCDPQHLTNNVPKFTCPPLLNRTGFWVVQLADVFLARNHRIVLCLGDAEMRLVIERNREECILNDLPVTEELWLVLDLYGRTKWAKFVQEGDRVPLEVYIRGPEAVKQHLHQIERNGSFPLIRTRLMLLGSYGLGKQLLSQVLSGHKLNESPERSGNFDIHGGSWHLLSGDCDKPEIQELPQAPEVRTVTAIICGEDHWSETLAANVVTELMLAKKRQRRDERRSTAGDGSRRRPNTRNGSSRIPVQAARNRRLKNGAHNKDDSRSRLGGGDSKLMYLLDSIPDRVLIIVETLMREAETKQEMDVEDSEKLELETEFPKPNVVPDYIFSVWELGDHTSLHQALHSLLMTPRAIYILVFDLNCNLEEQIQAGESLGCIDYVGRHFTHLDYLLYWMHTIYSYATPSVVPLSESRMTTLNPPILVVGCRKSSLGVEICENMIEEKFSKIRASISGKLYERHVVTPFISIDFDDEESDYYNSIFRLLIRLKEIICLQNYFGEVIPQSWFNVEDEMTRLVSDGINFISLEQLLEAARSYDIYMEDAQRALLHFLHDSGVVFHFGGAIGARDEVLSRIVILNPPWIIHVFNSILNMDERTNIENGMKDRVCKLRTLGILENDLLEEILRGSELHKDILLDLMEKLDLLSNIIDEEENSTNEIAFIPCMATSKKFQMETTARTCTFFFDFFGQIPGGLFHQLVARAISWSLDRKEHCKSNIHLFHFAAVLPIDDKHNFTLHLDERSFLLKVTIVQSNFVEEESPTISRRACAEVRELLESTLADLRELWVKRLAYVTTVICPCGKVCSEHQRASCLEDGCVHFLSLDECLSRNVIYCDHRKIKTEFARLFFPRPTLLKREPIIRDNVVTRTCDNETVILDYGNNQNDMDVAWKLRGIAKLLNDRHDWMALAKSLGYCPSKIADLEDDLNPSLALVADWLSNCGNGGVAVDMLAACLRQNGLQEAAELVDELKDRSDYATVFISYQWDIQDDILAIRAKLEEFGLTCWMDVGQMGGGDHLYNCIYQGIRRAKVVIACITPKYTVSHNCTREVSLADLLGKPIIPVMVRKTPWPPPGPLALLFSQLVYVDMCDGGGHGGRGRHGDWEDRVQEIILQISHHVAPTYHRSSPQRTLMGNLNDISEPMTNVLEEIAEEDHSESWSISDDIVPFEDAGPLPGMLPSPDDSVQNFEHQENNSVHAESEATSPQVQPSVTKCSICVIL